MFQCLAVDIGAGSGRIMRCVIDDNKKITLDEIARFGNESREKNGFLRWNVSQLVSDIKAGLAKAATLGKPDAIAVDTWGVDYVMLDKNDQLIDDPVCYRDPRTNGLAAEFTEKFRREKLQLLTGTQIMDINTLFQLYSEFKANPDYAKKCGTLLFTPDYITYCLTGKKANEFTIASTSQMLDCAKEDWSDELLKEVGLPRECVMPLTKPGTVVGTADFSGVPGLEGVPVVMVGSHDTASAVASSPAVGNEWAYVSSGTWCLVGIESKKALASKESAALNFTNEGGVAGTWRVLKNLTGFWILRGIKAAVASDISYDELMAEARKAKPFQSLFNPNDAAFFNPESMKDAIDEYMKKTGQPIPESAGAYTRAFLESLVLLFRKTIQEADSLSGKKTKTIHLLGGGAQNPTLCQFAADATGCEVLAGPVEATAIGNSMLQAVAVGKLASLEEARALVRESFQPAQFLPNTTAEWTKAYEKFLTLC